MAVWIHSLTCASGVRACELQADGDAVERAVLALAADKAAALSASGPPAGGAPEGGGGFDLVAAAEWPGVAEAAVLLSPPQCRALWRQFASDSAYSVQQVPPQAWALQCRTLLQGQNGVREAVVLLSEMQYKSSASGSACSTQQVHT